MELLDIVDENNNLTGKLEDKDEIHKKGLWHREVAIWIMNEEGRILLQKRALTKHQNPGKWALTAGHIGAGEEAILGAIRETKEEIGIDITKNELQELFCVKNSEVHPESHTFNNCYVYHYFLKVNQKVEEYEIQKQELSEVKYFSLKELEKITQEKNKEFVFSKKEYMPQIMKYLKKKRSEG